MKTLTPEEFIISRNFTSSLTKKEQKTYFDSMISHSGYIKAMEEYADYVLSIAAKKAEIEVKKKSNYGTHRKWQKVKDDEEWDLFDYEVMYSVKKDSILNCLKD